MIHLKRGYRFTGNTDPDGSGKTVMNFVFRSPVICSLAILLVFYSLSATAQKKDSIINRKFTFSGNLSITNNGFSLIPAFSLGKPAALVTVFAGSKRFSFEPEFRYSLEGKPWSFIFIWRYQLIKKEKFTFSVGTHFPALNFISDSVTKNGAVQKVIKARRFFPVAELLPAWKIRQNIQLSALYQYGRALEKELARHTHFLLIRAGFTDIPLPKKIYLRFYPQVYYLKMDANDGIYLASSLSLAYRYFPISLSSMINKAVVTDIPGKQFDWNLSLVYSFHSSYQKL